jgi:hypothetical protein
MKWCSNNYLAPRDDCLPVRLLATRCVSDERYSDSRSNCATLSRCPPAITAVTHLDHKAIEDHSVEHIIGRAELLLYPLQAAAPGQPKTEAAGHPPIAQAAALFTDAMPVGIGPHLKFGPRFLAIELRVPNLLRHDYPLAD